MTDFLLNTQHDEENLKTIEIPYQNNPSSVWCSLEWTKKIKSTVKTNRKCLLLWNWSLSCPSLRKDGEGVLKIVSFRNERFCVAWANNCKTHNNSAVAVRNWTIKSNGINCPRKKLLQCILCSMHTEFTITIYIIIHAKLSW